MPRSAEASLCSSCTCGTALAGAPSFGADFGQDARIQRSRCLLRETLNALEKVLDDELTGKQRERNMEDNGEWRQARM